MEQLGRMSSEEETARRVGPRAAADRDPRQGKEIQRGRESAPPSGEQVRERSHGQGNQQRLGPPEPEEEREG